MSTSDHKLSSVEGWSENRLELLRALSDLPTLQVQDFADDKLGLLLDQWSETSIWDLIERGLSRRLLGVYRLAPTVEVPVVRLDAAPFQTHGAVHPDGLLQYGYSKHHSNTGQFKVKFGVLDHALNHFSLPICHLTVSVNTSDDDWYQPIVSSSKAVFAGLSGYEKGNLYVGDSKFGSIGNRAHVVAGEDFYLMPFLIFSSIPERGSDEINSCLRFQALSSSYQSGKKRGRFSCGRF